MKLLLVLLLLIFPLVSTAAAYRWVDENGNVRFGSKPEPEKSEPAEKVAPKTPTKKPAKPIGTKPIPDKVLPTAIPTVVPEARRSENTPLSTQRPQHTKPATGTMPVDSKKTPKPEPARPVLKAIPTPAPIPAQRANKPPAAKPVPQKKKENVVKTAPKASKKISKPPASKPAKKKPATKKTVAAKKKTPAPKPAAPATDAGTDTDTDKNAELCGMFTNYVSNYQNKLIGCQGASCSIYDKSLVKYQKKQKTYCR